MDVEVGIPTLLFASVIFSIPYLILGMLFKGYTKLSTFLCLSASGMIAAEFFAYSSAYIFQTPVEGSEWIFMVVAFFQTVFAVAISLLLIFADAVAQSWVHSRKRGRGQSDLAVIK